MLIAALHRAGRWRSEYKVNLQDRKLEGKVFVNVHYYEQGNVCLPSDARTRAW